MAIDKVFQGENTVLNQHVDDFSSPLVAPVNKLDADEYSAEDLDGVSESLFGSGNLNFLSLQAGQANDAIELNSPVSMGPESASISNLSFSNAPPPTFDGNFSNENIFDGMSGQIIPTDTDRAIGGDNVPDIEAVVTDGNFLNTTVGSIGASALSSDAGAFSSASSGLSLGGDTTMTETINNNGGPTNIVNNTIDDTVQNVVNTVNETIENIFNFGDDIVENIIEGDITEVVNTLITEVTDVTNIANNLLQEIGITEITENVTNILNETVNNIISNITDILGDGRIALDLDGSVLDSLGLDLGVVVEDTIIGHLDTSLLSDGAGSLLYDLTGLDVPLLSDAGASIGFNLLNGGEGTSNAEGDSDITINGLDALGLALPDIALDPVEGLVGDIDIVLDIPEELTNPEALLEGVQDTVDALGNLELADVNEVLDIIGDEGLTGDLGIELLDTELGQDLNLAVDDLLDGDVLGDIGGLGDVLGGDLLGGDLPGGDLLGDIGGLGDLGNVLGGDLLGGDNILTDINDAAEGLVEGVLADGEGLGGLLEDVIEVADDAVDQVEDLLDNVAGGDVLDPVLEDALDLLGGGDNGGALDGLGDIWTDVAENGGGLFDDIIGGDLGGDVLPDPIGGIAEGLGGLDILLDNGGGGGGGLFGGLFG